MLYKKKWVNGLHKYFFWFGMKHKKHKLSLTAEPVERDRLVLCDELRDVLRTRYNGMLKDITMGHHYIPYLEKLVMDNVCDADVLLEYVVKHGDVTLDERYFEGGV